MQKIIAQEQMRTPTPISTPPKKITYLARNKQKHSMSCLLIHSFFILR